MLLRPLKPILAKAKTSRSMTGEELRQAIEAQFVPVKPANAVRMAVGGDLHFLHNRVPTYQISTGLRDLFTRYQDSLNVISLIGDVLDDSKYLRQEDTHEFLEWANWLLNFCKVNGISLWVLEGTPSHDHKQSRIFERLNKVIGADLKYFDGIGIFHDEKTNLTVGWVQDEYRRNARETEAEFSEMMATRGIEYVDIMLMHGCFTSQIPQFKSDSTFDESFWVPITKYGIYIGHDHKPKEIVVSQPSSFSQNGIIRVTGSWERLAQNEEGDKGFTIADFTPEGVTNHFHVNYAAVPQITVREKQDYDELYNDCMEALKYIDEHPTAVLGRLVIEYPENSPIADHIVEWKKEYRFNITGKRVVDKAKVEALEKAFEPTTAKLEDVTDDNAERLMLEELDSRSATYDPSVVSEIMRRVI